jgi:hypothetical protein
MMVALRQARIQRHSPFPTRRHEDIGTVLTDRLAWQPDSAMPALTIDVAASFADVTGEE